MSISIPLMENNVDRSDLDALIQYLSQDEPRITQGPQVEAFEREWSEWLGCKYSVFVNSGSSANMLTMAAIKHMYGDGEIIVPCLTWVSDISSVIFAGLKPVFVDIDPKNLAMDTEEVLKKITPNTKAVFLTHILGFNGLSQKLLDELNKRNILLIEDVCESHGASFKGKRLGSYGHASNFSFYFAHHMTTGEGGVVCTDNEEFYETVRMLRSHGMVREMKSQSLKNRYIESHPDLNSQFIFAYPSYNMRSTELNAVIGRNQLKKLDSNNEKRVENCDLFYANLDSNYYRTDFDFEGSVNYALVLVVKDGSESFRTVLEQKMTDEDVEFRRGTSGGGNQLRQPYARKIFGDELYKEFPNVDYIHFNGYYIGNFPGLEKERILQLCNLLNNVAKEYKK